MTNKSLSNERNHGGGLNSGLMYLLIGGGIGATLALLFAPKSGTELRHDIADISRRGYDEAADRAQQLKGQTADIYRSVKGKADEVLSYASTKLSNSGDIVSAAAEAVVDDVSKTASAVLDDANAVRKTGDSHRRPSSIM